MKESLTIFQKYFLKKSLVEFQKKSLNKNPEDSMNEFHRELRKEYRVLGGTPNGILEGIPKRKADRKPKKSRRAILE